MCEICDKNTSNEKYEKLINYVFKMKELNKIAFGKELFASIKGQRCFTKGQLGNQEGHVKPKHPPYQKLFLIILRKKFKKDTF